MKSLLLSFLVMMSTASLLSAGEIKPIKIAPRDKCPVCGMFVAKYSDFEAQIIFSKGSYAVFDGAKDMFKYYLNFEKYVKDRKMSEIISIYVKDYYSLKLVDAKTAWYVIGSDVMGPMGEELIGFHTEADAREFLIDHKGSRIVRFKEVTKALIGGLD